MPKRRSLVYSPREAIPKVMFVTPYLVFAPNVPSISGTGFMIDTIQDALDDNPYGHFIKVIRSKKITLLKSTVVDIDPSLHIEKIKDKSISFCFARLPIIFSSDDYEATIEYKSAWDNEMQRFYRVQPSMMIESSSEMQSSIFEMHLRFKSLSFELMDEAKKSQLESYLQLWLTMPLMMPFDEVKESNFSKTLEDFFSYPHGHCGVV
jgi:hypothetical protein